MTEFNPFTMDDETEAVPPAEEEPKKRGRKKKHEGLIEVVIDPRDGTKHVGGYFPKAISTELKAVCLEREIETGKVHSIQGLLGEGINHVLLKAGRHAVAKEN